MIFKNMEIPIIQGGMGIGVSLGNLAGHVALQGGMGVISAANAGFTSSEFKTNSTHVNNLALAEEITHAKKIANGAGMIAINAMVASKDYVEVITTALKSGIEAVISGAGLPLNLPEITKGYNTLLAPIVSSGKAAATICKVWKRKYEVLPDFVIIEGSQAGGHLGFSLEEICNKTVKSISELLQEVKIAISQYGNIPIFVAGGILTAEQVSQFIDEGATGVQVATPFIPTIECDASEEFKKVLIEANDDDVIIVNSPVGMPGRAIRSSFTDKVADGTRIAPTYCIDCLHTCDPKTTPYCITSALISAVEGDRENGLFFCSDSAGKINKTTTVKEVIDNLLTVWRKK